MYHVNAHSLSGMAFHVIITAAVCALALLATGSALRAQSTISMSYVTVGNPGNAADSATGSLYGSVSYSYDIGEYDVTDSQYVTFLNDVDPTGANTLGLYMGVNDPEDGIAFNSGAANGSQYSVMAGYANMPVVDETYFDAIRFVNWMNNGEGNASTETGAYTLLGGTPTPSNWETVTRNAGATVWLPSENEWYKAAYYDPANGTYSTYATQSDTAPGNMVGNGANQANYEYYNGSQYLFSATQSSSYNVDSNYLTPVGSFSGSASYYGTYDQSGDVYNWNDTLYDDQGDRVLHGGYWYDDNSLYLSSSIRYGDDPSSQGSNVGFRVGSIPEPNSPMLILAGVAGLALMRGKPLMARFH